MNKRDRCTTLFILTVSWLVVGEQTDAFEKQNRLSAFQVSLRARTVAPDQSILVRIRDESWQPSDTAIIVCDMWDSHHCLNAVRRAKQLAPHIDQLVRFARQQGATIIHAPSSCMEFYRDHPARQRALGVERAANTPTDIQDWCNWKTTEEQSAGYPIDATEGGEDDELVEHALWREQLEADGRNPDSPWKRQMASIGIDHADYVTDDGVQTWSILEHHKIKNVMLVGVHTNMCVLGRPFGLRQLAKNGVNVVLVRDLTDTMYDPRQHPFVSHFSGTDLIVEHVERHVCPTISSEQILGGSAFRFREDRRPHIVMMIGEKEYSTRTTLPQFAHQHLIQDHRVSYVFSDADSPNDFPEINQVRNADLLVVSVRRRTPPTWQLDIVKEYVDSGRPVIGIRTASHAFALREGQPPTGHAAWPEFDAEVFGGNYHGHHGNKLDSDERTIVWATSNPSESPLIQADQFRNPHPTTSWLYKTSPLRPGTHVLMRGRVGERQPDEPVTWTSLHRGNGRAFYTSLGHPDDFADPAFQTLLKNAIAWAIDRQPTN